MVKKIQFRDVLVLVFLVLNFILMLNGHNQLDKDILKISAEQARSCQVVNK